MKISASCRRLLRIFAIFFLVSGVGLMSVLGYLETRFDGKNRIFLPPASRHLHPEKKEFSIAVFGDFAMQSDAFLPILRMMKERHLLFIMANGDMFRRQSRAEGEYLLEMLAENLTVPLYAVPGNHDIPKPAGARNYERYFGQPYYFFGCGDTLFIVLNDGTKVLGDEQLLWLERTLAKLRNDFRRCVLFMHIPPEVPRREPFWMELKKTEVRRLAEILSANRIDAIISGHLHIADRTTFAGIPVYIAPCSGQRSRDTRHPNFGFLELRFPAGGGVEPVYYSHPGARRGRNHLLCWLVTTLPGEPGYFYAALAAVFVGMLLLILSRCQSKKAKN